MAEVVILGAGFGGLAAAYRVKKLVPDGIGITIVSDSDRYFYRPSLPYVALGTRSLDRISVPLAQALSRKGIRFIKGSVKGISTESCVVETDSNSLRYDHLVVALGSEIAFEEIKGSRENGYVLCEAGRIMDLKKAIEGFKGGVAAIVLTQNNPFELMDIGFTFTLDHLLRERGLRPVTEIHYFTPNGNLLPHLGEKTRSIIEDAFRQKDIQTHTGMHLEEVRENSVIFNGSMVFASHLSVLIPPYRGRQVIVKSGLGNSRGYISTDQAMRSLQLHNVYAVGDAVPFEGPKSGRRAMLQGKVAGENIASSINGRQYSTRFEEREIKCIVELGGRKAAYIRSSAYWGGNSESIWTGAIPYWMKVLLEKRFLVKKGDI